MSVATNNFARFPNHFPLCASSIILYLACEQALSGKMKEAKGNLLIGIDHFRLILKLSAR